MAEKSQDSLTYEIVSISSPGALLLLSIFVWWPVDRVIVVAKDASSAVGSVAGAFFSLLLCYSLGLFITNWAKYGFNAYVKCIQLFRASVRAWPAVRAGIVLCMCGLLHGRPFRGSGLQDVEWRMSVYERMRRIHGEGLAVNINPYDFLYIARIIMGEHSSQNRDDALRAADEAYRRRGYADSFSLSSSLIAIQALFSLTETFWRGGWSSLWPGTVTITLVLSVLFSCVMRMVAWRMYCDERLFTQAFIRIGRTSAESRATGDIGERV